MRFQQLVFFFWRGGAGKKCRQKIKVGQKEQKKRLPHKIMQQTLFLPCIRIILMQKNPLHRLLNP